MNGVQARSHGEAAHDGDQVDVPICDMNGEDAVFPQMSQVASEALLCQEMNRDGVTAEGVDNEEVELLRGAALLLGSEESYDRPMGFRPHLHAGDGEGSP